MMLRTLLLTLYLTKGLGNQKIYLIMEEVRNKKKTTLTIEEIFLFGAISSYEKRQQIKKSYEETLKHPDYLKKILNIPFITYWDVEYPEMLKEMYQFPVLLFYKGDLKLLEKPALGVVGTRAYLPYRKVILQKTLQPFLNDFVLVSGLAKGTDAFAHELCLENSGKTIAVLGTGLDRYYPKENQALQDKIAENGLLLSEYLPQVGPKRHHFPLRNRIIAGLSEGIVVLGAKEKSGSLITADWALEHNKEVFVIPGSILDENYHGSLKLIQQGAKCVYQSSDIIEELKQKR